MKLRLMYGAVLLAGLSTWASANVITVDTLVDELNVEGFCSLRGALQNVNGANQSGSTDCAAGQTTGNVIEFHSNLAGGTIVLNGSELPTINRELTLAGPVPGDPTGITLDGNQSSRVIRIQATSDTQVVLRDLTITGGLTSATSEPGGGIRLQVADVTLERIHVLDNRTTGNSSIGGGIYSLSSSLQVIDSLVSGNWTEGLASPGGGFGARSTALDMVRTEVRDNHTEGGNSNGGGLFMGSFGTALSGGTITDSLIANNANHSSTTFGGGLQVEEAELTVIGTAVVGNSTTAAGGGIRVVKSSLHLINSTLSDNVCGSGGCGLQLSESTADVLHATIAFNRITGSGARGISLFGTLDMPSTINLFNSLVVQELTSHISCSIGNHSSLVTENSFSTHDSCTGKATDLEAIHLGPLADHGGQTPVHPLWPGSVAIDAAQDCSRAHGIAQDQRGLPRPGGISSSCDVGAYESQVIPDRIFGDRFSPEF